MYVCMKHVPFWNMFQFGIVCRSEKCAILKHTSDWHYAKFVISKLHIKCNLKVPKHKNLCKETKSKATLLYLFVCFQ